MTSASRRRGVETVADKQMSAAQVVAQLKDGMTVGIGGWGPRRKPMALVREILRSPLKDLTIVAYGGGRLGMVGPGRHGEELGRAALGAGLHPAGAAFP